MAAVCSGICLVRKNHKISIWIFKKVFACKKPKICLALVKFPTAHTMLEFHYIIPKTNIDYKKIIFLILPKGK